MRIKMHFTLLLSIFISSVVGKLFVNLTVKTNDFPLQTTDKKFISVALDTAAVANHFKEFDMKNKRLYKLVRELAPGYLRIGGDMADRLFFSKNTTSSQDSNFDYTSYIEECAYEELDYCRHDFPNFTMSGDEWISLNNFAKQVNTKILFDLNCLIRNNDGSWNSKNAEELISFSYERKFDIDWQLGNEPDAFKHVFNYSVDASQLAKDFYSLRNILNKFPLYKKSILVGPDVTRPRPEHPASKKYLITFLNNLNKNVLNAVSFHQYYLNGRTATESDFLDSDIFYLLEEQINIVNSIVIQTNTTNIPVWLTETSSAYGGGAPGLSDTFVGSFLWLDKLGLSAKLGVKVVVRQSIKRDNYALIDNYYNPNPDWWLSVLFNKLVGHKVINCELSSPVTIRLYCHCSTESQNSTITIFGINISNSTVYVKVYGIQEPQEAFAYILTPKNDNLLTKKVLLNGKLLVLSTEADLPVFYPKSINVNEPFFMPAYSLAFWTVTAKNVKACSQGNF